MKLIPVENYDLVVCYRRKTKNYNILKEFEDSGMKVALLDGYNAKSASHAQRNLTLSCKRFGFNIKVVARGQKVFLVKVNPNEM